MSRQPLSRANVKARESVFASGPEHYIGDAQARCPPDLEECVLALEDCCEELYEAQMLLRNGTRDLPRMTRLLESDRVFLLVNERTIKDYKLNLAEEVEPAISELIQRAEQGLTSLEKQQQLLETKVENSKLRTRPAVGTNAVQKLENRRLQTLVKQREKLEAEVQALEREVLEIDIKNRK
ncbi:Spc19-domain-containing protein [Crepidotus variabilis]|uniref:DASH complex subunit SPC19 n=1 Tax=Crepidotus variabilis TaxID=179855 RepID=A0A9P6JP04_9AGAR|nr:Spc19-domain-containing protein [Crepidotus variabilis]